MLRLQKTNMKKTVLFFLVVFLNIIFVTVAPAGNIGSPDKDDARVAVVVIDPGHGGRDLGASFGNAREKDIVLDIALKLGTKITSAFPNVKLIYTRTDDVFVPLYERAEVANKNKADLFISIHVNSVEQTYVKGAETYVLGQYLSKDNLEVAKKENSVILLEDDYNTTYEGFDPNSPESYIMFELVQDEYMEQSVMFASDIQDQFRENAHRADRSVKQAGFIVLRRTTMPSVLIEAGFISNKEERKYMLGETGQNELATAIFMAFSEYKKRIEDKSSFSLKTENRETKENFDRLIDQKKADTPKNENIQYSVQIASSTRKLRPSGVNFKKEKNVFRKNYGNIYKYFTGSFKTYEEAKTEKERITKKFPDAFVVSFKNDELISVKMAHEN